MPLLNYFFYVLIHEIEQQSRNTNKNCEPGVSAKETVSLF